MEADREHLISTFISAAIESACQPPIILKQKNGNLHKLIAPLHSLFVLPFGSGKSVLASSIPNSFKSDSHTEPAIIGTITKDGELVHSDLINAANQVYVMDEAHRLSKKAIDAMLNLLESGTYTRSMGYLLKREVKLNGAGWQMHSTASMNGIAMRVNFSCVAFAEYLPPHMQGAFLSRFAVFRVILNEADMFDLLRGEGVLKTFNVIKDYKIYTQPMLFNNHQAFVDAYQVMANEKKLLGMFSQNDMGYIPRLGSVLAKLSAHYARINNRTEIAEEDYSKALKFMPLLMRNLNEAMLTSAQYNVYDLCLLQKKSQAQAAIELGLSEASVSEMVAKLRSKYLI